MASDLSSSPDWLSCSPTSPYIPVGSPNTLNTPQIVREGFVVPSPRNDIQRSNFSRTFFQPLLVGDEEERHNALIKITELLEAACDEKTQANLELLNSHLPTIVRLSTECPFPEIRKAFQEFLERIQETETEICVPSPQPFSSFFDASESALPYLLESGEFDQEFVARLCQFTFLHKGGVSHFVQLLAWHPSYLYKFFQTYDHLMYDNGVLCNDYCAYISILAASSHSCRYFIETQEQEFLDIDGDESWLEGIHAAPPKIQGLNKLNAILAHQPWRLKSSHIAELVGSGEDNWSLNELVHAILVMTTFHSISGVVLGCGILPEVRGKNFEMKWNDFSGSSSEEEEYSTPTLRLLKALSSCDDEESCQSANQPQSNVFETVDTERKRRSPLRRRKTAKNLVSKYRGDFVMSHEDFLINSPQYAVFHISDFSWKDQGYATVNEYFPSITPLLDAEFRKIYTLTYNTFSNNTDVDTSRFRMAVWHYVHRVQGLFHDDYSYDKVNFWLNIRLKNYIKTLVCYPQSMKKSDFQNMGITLTPQEKVHLTLLACEARKQAALLYGLRAIMTYQMEASRSNKN